MMQFKAFYFLLPLATAAAIFTYCAKDPQIPETTQTEQTATNQSATDRAKCPVTVTANSGSVTVCGTGLSLVQCSTNFLGNPMFGVAVLNSPNAGNYGVLSPGSIKITGNNGAQVPNVTVTTAGGMVTFSLLIGQTREVSFDAVTCAPTVI